MMKDVVISLHSTQNTGTDEEDTIDFSTDGMYTYDGENACITYLESEVTGLTGTRTSVIVTPDKVAVRAATASSQAVCSSWMVKRPRSCTTPPPVRRRCRCVQGA